MHALLQPGTSLLNRLRYPHKFLLISVLFLVPLVLAIGLLHSETRPRITFARQELAGSRYLRTLRQLLEHALEEQLLAQQAAQGDPNAVAALEASQKRLALALEGVRAADRELGPELGTSEALAVLETRWQAIGQQPVAGDAQYVALVGSIRELFTLVGDRSNLILDPDLASYYLMDAVLLRLPEQADLIAEAQSAVSPAAAPDRRGPSVVAGLLRQSNGELAQGLEVAFGAAPRIEQALSHNTAQQIAIIETFSALAERHRVNREGTSDAVLADAGNVARRSTFALWDAAVVELDALLTRRVEQLEQKNGLANSVALAILGIVLYLLTTFYASVMGTVQALKRAAQQLQDGGAPEAVELEARDELGDVARSFNTITAALHVASAERAAAQAEQERLQGAIIAQQQALLLELSTPVIPISEHVLVMPLIGTLDGGRLERLIAALAHGVTERRATTVILDLTGVPVLTADAAAGLAQAVDVARLLGAEAVLTGIRATVAKELVNTDIGLGHVSVHGSLQSGIASVQHAPGDSAHLVDAR